ncbi:uncharacterized protein BCR38DRAFT_526374 [Pseudomassariella vexata]|uniref:Alpha/Beta hydrolase protein n=1 Tax=Pseudomassariella vexata TaxID=1141098 RepID=A0A1Y2DNT6_9PEZI|nr:uncharacterized protein BCR38DRAFT_526374 [Pseudomassariella vexata]ORY60824.1 hypothetical protein BCR38DRAFT_526374 [Pseudomassariella vexata]
MSMSTHSDEKGHSSRAGGDHRKATNSLAQAYCSSASSNVGLAWQAVTALPNWYRNLKATNPQSADRPDEIKTYRSRPSLSVRIFYPASYPQHGSSQKLPTLFTVHDNGHSSADNNEWNRYFANTHGCLVISLDYAKSLGDPLAPAYDLQTLFSELCADESIPINDRLSDEWDTSRTAILGFGTGANLALTFSQLEGIRRHSLCPAAAVSINGRFEYSDSGYADPNSEIFRDPPFNASIAAPENLPPYVCCIVARVDNWSHEAWNLVERISKQHVLQRERETSFEEMWDGGGLKWQTVPGLSNGFDHRRSLGENGPSVDENSFRSTESHTREYVDDLGRWLKQVVWRT